MGGKIKKNEAKAFRELIDGFCLREFELANIVIHAQEHQMDME